VFWSEGYCFFAEHRGLLSRLPRYLSEYDIWFGVPLACSRPLSLLNQPNLKRLDTELNPNLLGKYQKVFTDLRSGASNDSESDCLLMRHVYRRCNVLWTLLYNPGWDDVFDLSCLWRITKFFQEVILVDLDSSSSGQLSISFILLLIITTP
jgi:hypothetical protein